MGITATIEGTPGNDPALNGTPGDDVIAGLGVAPAVTRSPAVTKMSAATKTIAVSPTHTHRQRPCAEVTGEGRLSAHDLTMAIRQLGRRCHR